MWDHFTKNECENRDNMIAFCNYGRFVFVCPSKSGTDSLCKHLNRCKKYPLNMVEKRQKILIFQKHRHVTITVNK